MQSRTASLSQAAFSTPNARQLSRPAAARAVRLQVQASAAPSSRRGVVLTSIAGIATLITASPAHAIFGLGGPSREEIYKEDTIKIVAEVRGVIDMARDAEGKEQASQAARKDINNWVAKYRRDQNVAGKPSFGNTYSALNAVAGHINSFGPTAPIPKKRLERLRKELDDADRLVNKGR